MPEKISWNLAVDVMDGPKTQVQRQHAVEAYDKLVVSVGAASGGNPTTIEVNVQPSDVDDVDFLFIASDKYGDDLKYSVKNGTQDIVLDGPQLLAGAGMVALLGTEVKKIEFSNDLAVDVVITILVGRQAEV